MSNINILKKPHFLMNNKKGYDGNTIPITNISNNHNNNSTSITNYANTSLKNNNNAQYMKKQRAILHEKKSQREMVCMNNNQSNVNCEQMIQQSYGLLKNHGAHQNPKNPQQQQQQQVGKSNNNHSHSNNPRALSQTNHNNNNNNHHHHYQQQQQQQYMPVNNNHTNSINSHMNYNRGSNNNTNTHYKIRLHNVNDNNTLNLTRIDQRSNITNSNIITNTITNNNNNNNNSHIIQYMINPDNTHILIDESNLHYDNKRQSSGLLSSSSLSHLNKNQSEQKILYNENKHNVDDPYNLMRNYNHQCYYYDPNLNPSSLPKPTNDNKIINNNIPYTHINEPTHQKITTITATNTREQKTTNQCYYLSDSSSHSFNDIIANVYEEEDNNPMNYHMNDHNLKITSIKANNATNTTTSTTKSTTTATKNPNTATCNTTATTTANNISDNILVVPHDNRYYGEYSKNFHQSSQFGHNFLVVPSLNNANNTGNTVIASKDRQIMRSYKGMMNEMSSIGENVNHDEGLEYQRQYGGNMNKHGNNNVNENRLSMSQERKPRRMYATPINNNNNNNVGPTVRESYREALSYDMQKVMNNNNNNTTSTTFKQPKPNQVFPSQSAALPPSSSSSFISRLTLIEDDTNPGNTINMNNRHDYSDKTHEKNSQILRESNKLNVIADSINNNDKGNLAKTSNHHDEMNYSDMIIKLSTVSKYLHDAQIKERNIDQNLGCKENKPYQNGYIMNSSSSSNLEYCSGNMYEEYHNMKDYKQGGGNQQKQHVNTFINNHDEAILPLNKQSLKDNHSMIISTNFTASTIEDSIHDLSYPDQYKHKAILNDNNSQHPQDTNHNNNSSNSISQHPHDTNNTNNNSSNGSYHPHDTNTINTKNTSSQHPHDTSNTNNTNNTNSNNSSGQYPHDFTKNNPKETSPSWNELTKDLSTIDSHEYKGISTICMMNPITMELKKYEYNCSPGKTHRRAYSCTNNNNNRFSVKEFNEDINGDPKKQGIIHDSTNIEIYLKDQAKNDDLASGSNIKVNQLLTKISGINFANDPQHRSTSILPSDYGFDSLNPKNQQILDDKSLAIKDMIKAVSSSSDIQNNLDDNTCRTNKIINETIIMNDRKEYSPCNNMVIEANYGNATTTRARHYHFMNNGNNKKKQNIQQIDDEFNNIKFPSTETKNQPKLARSSSTNTVNSRNHKNNEFLTSIKDLSYSFVNSTKKLLNIGNIRLKCKCNSSLNEDESCPMSIQWLLTRYHDSELSYLKGVYNTIMNLKDIDAKSKKQISLDVNRTYPDSSYYTTQHGLDSLTNILECIAKYDPQIGYVQGMNFIAATLLYHAEEYIAFWLFIMIFEAFEMRDIYMPNLPGLTKHSQIIDFLILNYLPKIYSHFCKMNIVVEMFCTEWICALFGSIIPLEKMALFMGEFIHNGWPFFYKMILSLLQYFENEILECEDMSEIMLIFKYNINNNHKQFRGIKHIKIKWEQIIKLAKNIELDTTFINNLHTRFDQDTKRFNLH